MEQVRNDAAEMSPYIIEMLHITKEFPGIRANDDITLATQTRGNSRPSW